VDLGDRKTRSRTRTIIGLLQRGDLRNDIYGSMRIRRHDPMIESRAFAAMSYRVWFSFRALRCTWTCRQRRLPGMLLGFFLGSSDGCSCQLLVDFY